VVLSNLGFGCLDEQQQDSIKTQIREYKKKWFIKGSKIENVLEARRQ